MFQSRDKKIKIGVCGDAQSWIIAFFVGITVKKSNFFSYFSKGRPILAGTSAEVLKLLIFM